MVDESLLIRWRGVVNGSWHNLTIKSGNLEGYKKENAAAKALSPYDYPLQYAFT